MNADANQPPREPNRPLSEIGHLFLSSIRDRTTNGAARPIRRGPNGQTSSPTGPTADPSLKPKVSIDLTPEEFTQAYDLSAKEEDPRPKVTAVIASHFNGRQIERTREYAAHLAATAGRVGLIELDPDQFRLTLFERQVRGSNVEIADGAIASGEKLDARRIREALDELSWDVDRWLLLLPNPRTDEARDLLRNVDQWTLLATCDHDGMVSCYRTIKGISTDEAFASHRPSLSLALLDVRSHDEADRVTLKLSGVCDQFLNWKLDSESVVKAADEVVDHLVLCCRANRETVGQPQFEVVKQFITRAEKPVEKPIEQIGGVTEKPVKSEIEIEQAFEMPTARVQPIRPLAIPLATTVAAAAAASNSTPAVAPMAAAAVTPISTTISTPVSTPVATPAVMSTPTPVTAPIAAVAAPAIVPFAAPAIEASRTRSDSEPSEVLEMIGDEANPAAVVCAFVRGPHGLAETQVKAPACPSASLAVGRDRKLVLVAVARQGLSDLRDIATAYRWLTENRPLIAMALPQFAIEPTSAPRLQLLVDQSDVTADVLQPLLKSDHVSVQTYRKLRWGGKTGLLLEAA